MSRWTINGLTTGAGHAARGIDLVAKNPDLRKHKFLRIFLYLSIFSFILFGIVRLLIAIPIYILHLVLHVSRLNHQVGQLLDTFDRALGDAFKYLPFLVLLFIRYVYPKPIDDLFMETLAYIDTMHPERPPFASALSQRKYRKEYWANLKGYGYRMLKNLRLGLIIYLVSLLPVVGRYAFPAAGAFATFQSLGKTQGVAVGICFLFLPRPMTIRLIRALIGMRALMRELLEPYFVRMNMTHRQKLEWFSSRKDVLFGFSALAYLLTRIPIVGFLGFGVAQAAAAYMLTVVADPPPPPPPPSPANGSSPAESVTSNDGNQEPAKKSL
ncbi:hypothetical protein BX666DRAFT_1977011 [Dichotomocladium elegans]|nr:hypothetical protein BX666DRAFT_1977011 [Dichotomocladium elegans]